MKSHACWNHPDSTPEKVVWAPGSASLCPHHEIDRPRRPMKWGKRASRRIDREAGVVGRHQGGWIDG